LEDEGWGVGLKKGGEIKRTTCRVELTKDDWRNKAPELGESSALTFVNVCFFNLVKF
jgi:hypothetical protein